MPRRIFAAGSVTNATGAPLRLAFYKTQTTGRQETDLMTLDGSSYPDQGIPRGIVLTTVSGAYATFCGPDDVDALWIAPSNGAARTQISATGSVAGSPAGGGAAALADQGSWGTTTPYAVGDVVTQSNKRYSCAVAHTSGTFATDLAASKWVSLDAVAAAASARTITAGTGLTGGGDLTADRTLTVAYGTTSGTAAQGNDTRITGAQPLTETVNTVATSGAAVTIPAPSTATINHVTLTAACTLTFPTVTSGQSFTLVLKQDGTGSWTVTWPGAVVWAGGVAPVLSTSASKRDVFSFMSPDGTSWFGFTAGQAF